MNFDPGNIQNNEVLDNNNNLFSANLETADYGLNPIADEFSSESQLNSIRDCL